MRSLATWSRRGAGLAVLLLSTLPLHRLLDPERAGPWAAQALGRAELNWALSMWGSVTVALVAILGAILRRARLRRRSRAEGLRAQAQGAAAYDAEPAPVFVERLAAALAQARRSLFAVGVALLAGVLAAAATFLLSRGLLGNVDEMASLVHARYLAAGRLAGQLPAPAEAWLIPNMFVVDAGWVSQYPPGHLLVLAAFVLAGLEWAAGPVLFALMAGLAAASLERLLPPVRLPAARAAVLLFALSPFAVLIGAGALSHVTAGMAGAATLYFALRAEEGRRAWAAAAGAAVGLLVLARPWTGLLLGPTLSLGVWIERGGLALLRRSLVPWIVGGVPAAALFFAYHAVLFGGPLTLGYEALYGPSHGIGFHADPWSFPYGVREAIAYSAADLRELGLGLLETPLSLALVVGAYLLLVPRVPRGARVLVAWALLPLVGNALYWFHQSRMLFEAAPAWMSLAVLAVQDLWERAAPPLRAGVEWAVVLALLVAGIGLAPRRLAGNAWTEETLARIELPEPVPEGALVFVHASWPERVASMLQATGMRNDSIQAMIRRNDTCDLHLFALWRLGGPGAPPAPPEVDTEQVAEQRTGLEPVQAPGGAVLNRARGSAWTAECARQVSADRAGSVALAPLLWQGDLPGLEEGRPLFVRDYGPERNGAVRAAFPARAPWVFAYPDGADGSRPALLPYDQAMDLLWGRTP